MKFRSDFVTNSSSSGFVAITINLKNGEALEFERQYNSGYGGYFWNGGDFEEAFDEARTGKDIIDAIIDNTEGEEFIEWALNNVETGFRDRLLNVKSVNEIKNIQMWEDTYYDDGDEESWDIDYEFSASEGFPFATAEEIRNIAIPIFCSVGKMTLVDWDNKLDCYENNNRFASSKDDFTKYASYHHWSYEGDLEIYLKIASKPYLNFCVVSDELSRKIDNGETNSLIKKCVRWHKELHFLFVREKDFLALGDYKLPKDIDTNLKGKRVIVTGCEDEKMIKRKVKELGGIIVAGKVKKDNVDIVFYKEITSRVLDAIKYVSKGYPILVVRYDDFFAACNHDETMSQEE